MPSERSSSYDFSPAIFDRRWSRSVVEQRAWEVLREHGIVLKDILKTMGMLDLSMSWRGLTLASLRGIRSRSLKHVFTKERARGLVRSRRRSPYEGGSM